MKKNTDFYDSLDQLDQHLVRGKHYRLRIFDRRKSITIIAPHGGYIEQGTSALAQAIAGAEHNLFDFQGLRQRRAHELHVTSTNFRHPYLVNLLGRSKMALSVHSMGTENNGTILVGGLNKEVKARIVQALLAEGYPATTTHSRHRGVHPQNIVNLAPDKGVQIELTSKVIARMFETNTQYFKADGAAGPLTAYGERFVAIIRQCIAG